MLRDFLNFERSGEIELLFQGFFNVEGGSFQVSVGYFPSCEECDQGAGSEAVWSCSTCGRGSENTIVGKSGDGDGVYTSWNIWNYKESKTVGLVAFFDSDYALANACRRSLEESGTRPDFKDEVFDLLQGYSATKKARRGTLLGDDQVLIGGNPFGLDMNQPALGLYMYGSEFEVSLFLEEPGRHSGAYNNDLEHKPRAILLLNKEYSAFSGPDDIPEGGISWAEEDLNSLMVLVASHLESMTDSIPPINFLTHYCQIDREDSLLVDGDWDMEQAASWAMFEYVTNGNRELVDLMIDEGWDFSHSDVEEILLDRGLQERGRDFDIDLVGYRAANSALSHPTTTRDTKRDAASLSTGDSNSLPKSKPAGLNSRPRGNVTAGTPSVHAPIVHKFCFECGSAIEGNFKFCSNCGTNLR